MSNLVDIQNQIETLTKQANAIRAKEFDKTVADIRVKMLAFGITVKDLRLGVTGKPTQKARRTKSAEGEKTMSRKARGGKAVTVAPVKYRGPNGETWSGRGLTPRWLAAVISTGKMKDDFLIKN